MSSPLASGEQRWIAHPWLARLLRLVLFCTPLVAATVVVRVVAGILPAGLEGVARLIALGVAGFAVAVLVERLARRFLPLAALLRLTMLFPDQAPSRFKVARAAGDSEALGQRLAQSGDRSAQAAAEQVLTLITTLSNHDRRTRGHCERVRVFTDLLAEELHLDTAARDRLRWAALLHDVGKLNIPEQVLNKPGKLDAGEFARMKRHPEWGAQFAAPLLPWLGEWGRGILEHHERYDGTGYPQGLERAAISPAGRIIGLIDAFETMTAARTYKKAMTTRAAREELARCAGSHFDPGYVRTFLAVSLPRVLWTMGPLALVLQLPFLRSIAEAGARAGASTTTAASAMAGSGVVAAGVTGALLMAPAASGTQLPDAPPKAAAAAAPAAPAPDEGAAEDTAGETAPEAAPAASEDAGVVDPAADLPAAETATAQPAQGMAKQASAAAATATTTTRTPALAESPAPVTAADGARAPGQAPAGGSRVEAPSWTTGLPAGTTLGSGIGGTVTGGTEIREEAPRLLPRVELLSAPTGTVRDVDAVLSFRSDLAGASFVCALDGAAESPCTSPAQFHDLADGSHTVDVRAVAPDGVAGPPVTAAFSVAARAIIDAGPRGRIWQRTATFGVAAPRPTDALECRLDDGAWSACDGQVTYSGVADGQHTFAVRIVGSAERSQHTFVVNPDAGPAQGNGPG